MNLKKLEWTITGIVIAIVEVLIFNTAYYGTFVLIGNKNLAFNVACIASSIILIGVIIDCLRNTLEGREIDEDIDLADRRFNTVYPPTAEEIGSEIHKKVFVNETTHVENLVQPITGNTFRSM